jgi:hypothetical protein
MLKEIVFSKFLTKFFYVEILVNYYNNNNNNCRAAGWWREIIIVTCLLTEFAYVVKSLKVIF